MVARTRRLRMQRRRTQRGGGGVLNRFRRALGGSPKLTPAAELLVKQRKERLELTTKKEDAKKTLEAKISKANPLYNKFYTRIEAAETLEELHICVEFLNKTVFALELLFENKDNLSESQQKNIIDMINVADHAGFLATWVDFLQTIKFTYIALNALKPIISDEEYNEYLRVIQLAETPAALKAAVDLFERTYEARSLAPPKAGGRRSRRSKRRY
jgi:hypothetical protein